jgi:predicted nuclease with TOPRIM domain
VSAVYKLVSLLLRFIAMKKTSAKAKKPKSYKLKSDRIPATRSMLFGVRDELMKRFNSHDRRFDSVSAQIGELNSRFATLSTSVKDQFGELNQRLESQKDDLISQIRAATERLSAEIRRQGVLAEDQNAKNLYVVDGITSHSHRMDAIEKRINYLEKDWRLYKKKDV